MSRTRVTRNIATSLLITAAGIAIGVLWASRRQPTSLPARAHGPAPTQPRSVRPRVVSPLDAEEPELTAAPRSAPPRITGADDFEVLGPDQLSEAFLTRATESWSSVDVDESSDVDLQGFQLATVEDLTTPKLTDDPADFEIPETRG